MELVYILLCSTISLIFIVMTIGSLFQYKWEGDYQKQRDKITDLDMKIKFASQGGSE